MIVAFRHWFTKINVLRPSKRVFREEEEEEEEEELITIGNNVKRKRQYELCFRTAFTCFLSLSTLTKGALLTRSGSDSNSSSSSSRSSITNQ
jgi:hypothetical protein